MSIDATWLWHKRQLPESEFERRDNVISDCRLLPHRSHERTVPTDRALRGYEHFPGWIVCEFRDVESRCDTVVGKIPIFGMDPTLDPLDSNTKYPQPAGVACEILDAWRDSQGRDLVRITIDRPWHLESTEKLSEFVVLATQVSESPARSAAK